MTYLMKYQKKPIMTRISNTAPFETKLGSFEKRKIRRNYPNVVQAHDRCFHMAGIIGKDIGHLTRTEGIQGVTG